MTPQLLARKDHTRDRRKSGVAIADALGLNWRDLPDDDARTLVEKYETAWWTADEKADTE